MKKPKIRNLIGKSKERLKPIIPAEPTLDDSETPRITNETVAEHRDKVLSRARKYIYPLQHSKHKIVLITTGLFLAAVISFFTYCTLALYHFKTNSGFLYGVTKVIPFPFAKVGGNFVAYENYLFELRHYVHYYETQQKVDFSSVVGKQQLADYERRALQKVVNDAYVKQLAAKNNVSISDRELNDEITLVRSQNRLGSNEKGFEDVLKENFGWSLNDFKRSLKQEMLAQKLVATLDKTTLAKAQAASAELVAGAKFEDMAKKYSEDKASAATGGEYGFLIDKTNRDLAAQVTQTLFQLKPGQVSDIINTGFTLEIVKTIEFQDQKVRAAHITFSLKDINYYLNPVKDKEKTRLFIGL